MRIFPWFWMGGLLMAASLGSAAQTGSKAVAAKPAVQRPVASGAALPDNPVADPKAIVTLGNARFTVLTPQLIRMEWSADGKFEDHASFVFINRRLPVPEYEVTISGGTDLAVSKRRHGLTIKTWL